MNKIVVPFNLREKIFEKTIPFLENQKFYEKKLFLNYEEIENLKRLNKKNFLEILYFDKQNVHYILDISDNIIILDDSQTRKINNLFYLNLLIADNPYIINYIFSINSIIIFYKQIQSKKECHIKVILAKMLIDMIENYEGFISLDNENQIIYLESKVKKCKEEIKAQIKNNRNIFNNYEKILDTNVDKLYMDIFLNIFNTEKDSLSYDDVYKTLNYLEFEEINITEIMFIEFKAFIKREENNKNNFFIKTFEDLFNIKKINFYYIILKYFLKNPIYIYHFSFLLNTRKMIVELIKNNLYKLVVAINNLENSDLSSSKKLIYIIKVITDSEYYIDKYYKMKESIKEILDAKNIRYIFPLFEGIKDDIMEKDKNKNEFSLGRWQTYEKMIKEKRYKKIHKNFLNKLLLFFKEEKNKSLLLKIFTQEQYESFINLNKNSNSCKKEEKNKENKKIDYLESECECEQKHEEYLSENEKEIELEEDLEKKQYLESSMIIQSYTIKEEEKTETEASTETINDNPYNIDFKMYHKSNKYKVIEYYKVIEKENDCDALFNYSKNLSKGHYITKINNHKLSLYNSFFEKKLEIDLFREIKGVQELKNDKNDEIIQLMACCNKKLTIITINLNNYFFKHSSISREKYVKYSLFEQIDNDYYVFGEKGGFTLFGQKKENIKKIFDENFLGKVKITNNIYAFISNKMFPKGIDKLIIYDFDTNKTLKIFEDYCFNFSENAICLIDVNNIKSLDDNQKILLCSCQKNKKNGILVFNINIKKNEFLEKFYETKNFEPSCFCQISNVSNNNSIMGDISDKTNIDIQETEYFIVGGFDSDRRKGSLRLYKLKRDKTNNNIKIKYLLDIVTEDKEMNFQGFDMTITCITQSKITGNLLINCLDGNVFLFKPPNLEFFLDA